MAFQPGNGSRFAYPETPDEEEKEKPSGPEAVYKVISEQAETDFEDMVACNLVQFEYDLFQQIKSQLQKKTNALFLVCRQLVKAFIGSYSHFTQLDGKVKDRATMRRQTKRMKSTIQEKSMAMMRESSNTALPKGQKDLDTSELSNDLS